MTAEEVLRSNEESAAENNQIISSVVGKGGKKGSFKIKKGLGATIFITLIIGAFMLFFSVGNLIPSAISERLIEETDVQYTDAVQMKARIFQDALAKGEVPKNTAERLKNAGVVVGNGSSGSFSESDSGTSLKIGDKVVTASEFTDAVMKDARLYDAFTSATYGRAAYYYDEAAETVFKKQGMSRNNYKDSSKSFEEIMSDAVGEGNNIVVGEGWIEKYCKQIDNEETKEEGDTKEVCWNEPNNNQSQAGTDANTFVDIVGSSHSREDAASTLNIADSIATEQKSSTFYMALMENISKMKAGYGNDSRINEAMNYLYDEVETEVVDVNTGEITKVTGSALESPSLYAILSGEKLDTSKVKNYSTNRVLDTVMGGAGVESGTLFDSYTSTETGMRGTIGNWYEDEGSADGSLQSVVPIIDSSLMNNSFDSIKGINAGELLVQGAVNIGASLALQSGATVGDESAVIAYRKATEEVLAIEAEVDRLHRSPLDITSKNTFLGSILYKFGVSTLKSGTLLNKLASVSRVTASSIASILPSAHADDEKDSYMTNYGDCDRMTAIGAVGTATCSRNETFDLSTLDINDPEFLRVVSENVEQNSDGTVRIKDGSEFQKFVKYNSGRITPVGVTDGGILQALNNTSEGGAFGDIPFISSIRGLFSTLWDIITGEKEVKENIATGAAFVNSSSNSANWNTYKYAQRYVSMVRARDALRMYDGDSTAYSNVPYVGIDNPVLACLNEYYNELLALETNE